MLMNGNGLRNRWRNSGTGCIRLLTILWCAISTACSEVSPSEHGIANKAALIGGSLSPPERDAVVFIRAHHLDGSFADCTGTLLSPHVVITAKHCVTLIQPGQFVCTGAGSLVETGQGAGIFGANVAGAKIEIYTGTAPVGAAAAHVLANFTSESSDACHDDIAALVLDTPIQQASYPMLRVARPVTIGDTVMLVGYGAVTHDTLIERREIADVRVIDVGRDNGVPDPNATTPARAFVVAGATACFGDSGGPALAMDTGALTGVYSRITGDCYAADSRNDFILASSFAELFAHAFSQAGELPQLEPDVATSAENPDAAAGTPPPATDATTATGGAPGEVAASNASMRHEALRCAIELPNRGSSRSVAAWLLLALTVGLSRRYFGARLF